MLWISFLFFVLVHGEKDVLLNVPVTIDGIQHNLQLLNGETVDVAAATFAQKHQLAENHNENELQAIIQQLSTLLTNRLAEAATPKPLLSIPLTIDGATTTLEMYENQRVDHSIGAYFKKYNIPENVQLELYPQLEQLVAERATAYMQAQVKAQRQLMFTMPISVADQEFQIHHYENGNVLEEAKEFCITNNILPEFHDVIVPQAAQLLQQRVQIEMEARQGKILMTIPITINQQEFTLHHYEKYSPMQSAIQFLLDHGVKDQATAEPYLPQLVQLIEQHLQGLDQVPLILSIPLVVNQQQVALDYYDGDNPELTAQSFAVRHGLKDDPAFQEYVTQWSTLIRNQLQEKELTAPERMTTPLFSLPISLNDTIQELHYPVGASPISAAQDFCETKAELIINQNSTDTIEAQLAECTSFLSETISSVLQRLEKERRRQPVALQLLFTLEMELDGKLMKIPFYEGNGPEDVARTFCTDNGLNMEHAPEIEEAIRKQIASL